jgi:hypothetical protein
VLPEAELSPARLAGAVAAALGRRPGSHGISLAGAERSVRIVESWASRAPAVLTRWDWTPLASALQRARDAGWEPRFWWRDDDAAAETPALRRLLDLAERYRVPLALAVVPRRAQASLAAALAETPAAVALVHGLSHRNHAQPGEKKAEFGPQRPLSILTQEAEAGLEILRETLGREALPVFVPPWNRIAPDLVSALPGLGYAGLSRSRDRAPAAVGGLVEINTHLDPIDWHGSRSLCPPDTLIAAVAAAVDRRLAGLADRDEPIGLLTHHLAHDEPVWAFCNALLETLAANAARFADARALFSGDNRSALGL